MRAFQPPTSGEKKVIFLKVDEVRYVWFEFDPSDSVAFLGSAVASGRAMGQTCCAQSEINTDDKPVDPIVSEAAMTLSKIR